MQTVPRFRRLRPLPVAIVEPQSQHGHGQNGHGPVRPVTVVQQGTRGIYDPDERVRTATARAMVQSRQTVPMICAWPDCVDPETGRPRAFLSRLVDGKPERRACSPNHRLKLWRRDMRERGYVQVTVGGRAGWRTPEGTFYPYPSSRPRSRKRRRRRQRQGATPPPIAVAS
jgi:hypothetical protein